MTDQEKLKASRDSNLSQYGHYNNTLRSWLVAFGIAVPAVFVTSKDAKEFLLRSPDFQQIIVIFLLGAASQVAISFLNKFIAWSAYHRDDKKLLLGVDCHPFFKTVASLENEIWIDFLLDLATVGCFVWAIVKLLAIDARGV